MHCTTRTVVQLGNFLNDLQFSFKMDKWQSPKKNENTFDYIALQLSTVFKYFFNVKKAESKRKICTTENVLFFNLDQLFFLHGSGMNLFGLDTINFFGDHIMM